MKKILFIVLGVLIVVSLAITFIPFTASAVDTVETTTAVDTEQTSDTEDFVLSPSLDLIIGSEEAKEVVDVLEHTSNKAEAILVLAERLGITAEDAETLINAVIEIGDEYFGQDQWWIAFRNDVKTDIQFWTTAVVILLMVVTVAVGAVVLLSRTNPNIRKIRYGVSEGLKITQKSAEATSQSLGNIELLVTENIKKDEVCRQLLDEKEKKNEQLLDKIAQLEASNERERRDMLMAEAYNLRMLKLIIDRTALPLADKATIDLFYAKGIDSIKAELSEEDVEKLEQTTAVLDKVKNEE